MKIKNILLLSLVIAGTFIATLFMAGPARVISEESADESANHYDALKILLSMKDSYNTIESYTAVMVKGEPGAKKRDDQEKILLKFKKPFKVYMKWVEDSHAGREVLYVQGENNDNMFAKPEGFLGFILRIVKLPSDYIHDGSGRTIKDVGIGRIVDGVIDVTMKAMEKNDLVTLSCKGVVVRNGRECYLIERLLPIKDCYKNIRLVLYVDKQTGLPLELYIYDGNGKLSEYCMYQDVKINPQLKDEDFKVDNKEYGFRYL